MTNCSLRYFKCSKERRPNGFTELTTHHIISVLILILNSNSGSPSHSSLGCGRSALSSLSCMCLRVYASAWEWAHVCSRGFTCACMFLRLCLCICACVPVLCVCVPVSVLGSKIRFSRNRSWELLQQGWGDGGLWGPRNVGWKGGPQAPSGTGRVQSSAQVYMLLVIRGPGRLAPRPRAGLEVEICLICSEKK